MRYTARLFASIHDVPLDDWNAVHKAAGDPFTDPRFVELVEETLQGKATTEVVLFYDPQNNPVAITTLAVCRLDVAMEAGAAWRRIASLIRRMQPNFLRLRTAMCGLPVTFEQQKLCCLPSVDRREVARALADAASVFARRHRASVIVLGDFFAADAEWLDVLSELGYIRGGSFPSYFLELDEQSNFAEYLGSLRAPYRNDIQHDLRLLDSARVRIESLTEAEMMRQPITEELYAHYLRLMERAEFHLMTLPREFFNELLKRFASMMEAMIAYVDDKPIGFCINIRSESTYQLLNVAVDEELSRRFGIYRNIYFRQLEFALSQGLRKINMGTLADDFKLRIGGRPYERILYVRALGMLRLPFRILARQLVPRIEAPAARNVFRSRPRDTKVTARQLS